MVPGPSSFFFNKLAKVSSLSNGLFLSHNMMLEQLEVPTLPSRNHFFRAKFISFISGSKVDWEEQLLKIQADPTTTQFYKIKQSFA